MPSWTGPDVERWMVVAERADPRVRNGGEARPLTWPDRFLEDADERRALTLWVWCQARGYGFHDVCKRRGIPYTSALRRKNAGVQRIAMLLNLEDSMRAEGHLVARAD